MLKSRPVKEKRGKRRELPKQSEPSEEELESKTLNVQHKRFYLDAKQNNRGRFIKITETGVRQKSRIIFTMSVAVAFAEKIDEMKKILEKIPEKEDDKEEIVLKSETLNHGQKRFYLDLKQNTRGRFLRIAQTRLGNNSFLVRTQVVIPASGIDEFLTILQEFIDKYSEGYLDDPAESVPMKKIDGESDKYFTFDRGTNERGSFLKITEAKKTSGFRGGITVPAELLPQFRDAFNEFIEDFKQDLTKKVGELKL